MSTYENAYRILEDVRHGINDYSADLLTGDDATGAYKNSWLLKRINDTQRRIHALISRRLPEALLASASITLSSGEGDLPWDLGMIIRLEDSTGYKLHRATVNHRPKGDGTGSRYAYYRKGNKVIMLNPNQSGPLTLWYRTKPREIHSGKAADGSAASITLSSSYAKKIADYYNGMTIENETQDWVDTVDDYSAARVATITETAELNDVYGIVSDLPETFHHLIAPGAIILAKLMSPVSFEKPTNNEIAMYAQLVVESLRAFAGNKEDVPIEDIFTDFGPGLLAPGVDVPGHGSLI